MSRDLQSLTYTYIFHLLSRPFLTHACIIFTCLSLEWQASKLLNQNIKSLSEWQGLIISRPELSSLTRCENLYLNKHKEAKTFTVIQDWGLGTLLIFIVLKIVDSWHSDSLSVIFIFRARNLRPISVLIKLDTWL